MELAFIHIGLAHSLFAGLIMLLKRPLAISDKLLSLWLFVMACMFALNVFKQHYSIEVDLWPVSIIISLTWHPLFYLYSKYVIKEYERFSKTDLLLFIPSLIVLLIILFHFYNSEQKDIDSLTGYFYSHLQLRKIVGWSFIGSLWVYAILTLRRIFKYQKQITSTYSYESDKINLTWLITVIVIALIIYNFIILMSAFHTSYFVPHIEIFRSGALLTLVYVISVWGYRQNQLNVDIEPIRLNKSGFADDSASGKYQTSSLKEDLALEYKDKIIDFMNHSQIWKDNELTVSKLSSQIGIPKHYITQVLNENIKKNFYNFINEYRVECAKKLIKSPEHKAWSFVAIAYESGFNSKSAFYNFFKKHTGMTPTEYKNT